MIVLYRRRDSAEGAAIAETLRDLVVAHEVVTVDSAGAVAGLPDGSALPALREGRTFVSGAPAIRGYLEELTAELRLDRSISGDACYLDPNRPGQCV